MRTLAIFALILATTAGIPSSSYAAQAYIYGDAATPCRLYAENRLAKNDAYDMLYAGVVNGYISGYNVFTAHQQVAMTRALSQGEILAFLDGYCAAHPTGILANAMDALIAELGGYKAKYLK